MDPDPLGNGRRRTPLIGIAVVLAPLLVVGLFTLLVLNGGEEAATVTAAPAEESASPATRDAGAVAFTDESEQQRGSDAPIPDAEGAPAPEAEPALPAEPEPGIAQAGSSAAAEESSAGSRRSLVVEVRRGETVELLDAPGGDLVAEQGDATEFGSPSVFWVRDREPGWLGVSTPEVPNGEIAWIRADRRRLESSLVGLSIEVDLSARTAGLLWEGRELRSWPVTVGAPGAETPTGRFAVTDTFAGDLNPAYGCCALALSATQPNLPSGWLGGNRIAIHGTSGPLGVAVSSGCIRSADRDLKVLMRTVSLGTPVAIQG